MHPSIFLGTVKKLRNLIDAGKGEMSRHVTVLAL